MAAAKVSRMPFALPSSEADEAHAPADMAFLLPDNLLDSPAAGKVPCSADSKLWLRPCGVAKDACACCTRHRT